MTTRKELQSIANMFFGLTVFVGVMAWLIGYQHGQLDPAPIAKQASENCLPGPAIPIPIEARTDDKTALRLFVCTPDTIVLIPMGSTLEF